MLNYLVELYRLAGRPDVSAGTLTYSGVCDSDFSAVVKACDGLEDKYGRFSYLITPDSGCVEFEYILPSGDCRFFSNFSDFVKNTPSLSRGEIPVEFYIVEDDWVSTSGDFNQGFEKINNCCRLINALSKVVLVSDALSSPDYVNLIITVVPHDSKVPKAISLPTVVDERVLECDLSRLRLIEYFAQEENKGKIHFDEKKAILNSALSDVIGDSLGRGESSFMYLLCNWGRFLDFYWKNLQVYMHGFSFNALRQDIAKAELEYGSKISGIFSDVAGKLLALPVSLGALVILYKADQLVEVWAGSIGIFLVTLIFWGVLYNQWLCLRRLYSSFLQVFSQFSGQVESYPNNLRKLIVSSREQVVDQFGFVKNLLLSFAVLALIPSLGVFVVLWLKWWGSITFFWHCVI